MSQPGYLAPPPPKPPRSGTDLAISITALVLTVILGAGASVLGLFSLAFLDSCPPESCSAEGAATAVFTALIGIFVIGVIGLVITVVQLYRRKPGWPFAVGTLVLCGVACVCGMVGYAVAVGG
jgi:quinol-cytochrome oxidoreductase complex cytochrome b subunit